MSQIQSKQTDPANEEEWKSNKELNPQEKLSHVFLQRPDSAWQVEAACWKMLKFNSKLLVKQQAMLDQVIEQQPALAKRLILKLASTK